MGIPARPHIEGETPRTVEHEQHNADKHSIARQSTAAKRGAGTPPIHGGMTAQQKAGAGVGGMGHSVQVQGGGEAMATNANKLPHAYDESTLNTGVPHPKVRAVPTTPGMRSRTNSSHPNDQGAGDAHAARRLAEAPKLKT
jgi:hypothetical protein